MGKYSKKQAARAQTISTLGGDYALKWDDETQMSVNAHAALLSQFAKAGGFFDRFVATTIPSDSCRRFRVGSPPKFPYRTFGTRHVPMPRPVGRAAKRLRRVRVGFRYHDTLGHGRPFG